MSAAAMEVMENADPPMPLSPKLNARPPMPVTKIAATTKRFLLSPRSTFLSICRPLTAINPYIAMHAPPITHLGMELMTATKGLKKESTIQPIAAVKMETVEAFFVIATQPMDSPYVVFSQPPKKPPTMEPMPSPRRVLVRPGSLMRSFSMMALRFL